MKRYCGYHEPCKPYANGNHYIPRTDEELIERSTLLDVVCRYLDTHTYIDRSDLAAMIGHGLPAQSSEAPHDPLS